MYIIRWTSGQTGMRKDVPTMNSVSAVFGNTLLSKLFISFFCLLCSVPSAWAVEPPFTGKVVGVSDGDTITVMHKGRGEKVRLFGIDCPEKNQDFGERAKKETSALVFGKDVTVFMQGYDRYGRMLGIVGLKDGQTVNHLLIQRGMCWWYERYAPNDIQAKNLPVGARKEKLGLWEMPNPTPPWEFRKVAKAKDVRKDAGAKSRGFGK